MFGFVCLDVIQIWDMLLVVMSCLCYGCSMVYLGGRLRYSRYAVRPYIGGMYHQGDGMLDVYVSYVYGPT